MKTFLSVALVLCFSLVVALPLALADQAPAPVSAVAAHVQDMSPVLAAAPAMPQFVLPANHDAGSILVWVFAVLIPCLGWLASEIMPFLPGKGNGLLHAFLEGLKAPSYDPQTQKLTVDIAELKQAIADLKPTEPAAPAV